MKKMRHHVFVSIWIYDVILFSELMEDSREMMKENICVFTAVFTSRQEPGCWVVIVQAASLHLFIMCDKMT